jgi:electron transfer flavoprotein beta subunit
MKILVPVKRVPDPYAKIRFNSDRDAVDFSSIKFEINPFDEIALEAATQLKEAKGDFEIIAASIGADSCEEQLRKALAMGADRAILIQSDNDMDSGQIAQELAELVKEESIDLVLMGKQATDDDSCQAGQMLAAMLDWPQACFASKISLEAGTVTVTRETDMGDEVVNMSLPAVITADLRLATPRYIALPGIIKARGKPLIKRPKMTDAPARVKVMKFEPPPPRSPGKKVANVEELKNELVKAGVIN